MNFSHLFQKKTFKDITDESEHSSLKRTLGPFNLISLGIGCIIGTGIFVLTGQQAALHAGPAIIISFVFAGLCSAFAALCYAELASMLPVSGSAYSYAYASLGEIFAWIMGWLLILEYGAASSTVAVGWSGYVVSFINSLGVIVPPELTTANGQIVYTTDSNHQLFLHAGYLISAQKELLDKSGNLVRGLFNLPATLGVLAVSALLIRGVKESANVNNVIVFTKVAVIIAFICIGAFYVDPHNWHPFIPKNTGTNGQFGFSGILKAAGIIFFAYIGFEAVSTAAQEAKNPPRDIPIGILGSLTICTILYILVSLVLTGIMPYTELNVPDPIAVAADHMGIKWFSICVKIGAIMGLSSVMLVLVYGQTRIFYAMSVDGLIPKFFSIVHPKFQTPHYNTIAVGILVALAAGIVPLDALSQIVSVGTLIAFAIICFSVIYLRWKQPNVKRPFRVPLYPVVPYLGIASCLYLISGIYETVWNLKWYFLAGLIIYFAYGQFRSKLTLQGATSEGNPDLDIRKK